MLIASYGSLRKGFHNHHRLGENALYKGSTVIKGIMYLVSNYPHFHLVEPEKEGHTPHPLFDPKLEEFHHAEVYDISSEAYNEIDNMECGAGYINHIIETEFGPATIWINPNDPSKSEGLKYIEEYTQEIAYPVNLPLELHHFLFTRANENSYEGSDYFNPSTQEAGYEFNINYRHKKYKVIVIEETNA